MENQIKPGDSNRITREYLDSLLIEMRHLDGAPPCTRMELYGHPFETPIMTAAFSHLATFRYHDDGMAEVARAAQKANAINWAGMGSDEELEKIIATGAKTIKIIKPYKDNDRIFQKIVHAERAGAIAVGMDIDHSFNRAGEYDLVLGEEMRPKSTQELSEFVRATKLPFIVKGVLSVRDAVKCAEVGVKGIVVSHHHGIIDYAMPPLAILPEIVREVGAHMPVFADCGIASGYDVFKALTLGATAACIGRAILDSLRSEGADGAAKWLETATRELKGIMARTGCKDLSEIDASLIRRI